MTGSPEFERVALTGGVCAPAGVSAAGVSAGLKPSGKPDLALVATAAPVPASAVQTRNQVRAAPVEVTARHVADGRAQAVLLNAGSANACTGPDGEALAEESAAAVAKELGCRASDVLLCSTGVIGVPIPREPLLAGIPKVVAQRSSTGGRDAAMAIMTTDTVPKEAAIRVSDESGSCVVGGMVKGSGMIDPALATMLCVLTTDAQVRPAVLRATLRDAVNRTFGRISVDGCLSTNDAVIALATGAAGRSPSLAAFAQAMNDVCGQLAEAVVRDAEGATKVLRITVAGARRTDDAVAVGRAVGSSLLVKTAVAGGDPNWGRVLAAVGAAGVPIDPSRISVAFGGVTVCRLGAAASFDRAQAVAALAGGDVDLRIDLGLGDQDATFLTCDLTHDYVTINAEYTT